MVNETGPIDELRSGCGGRLARGLAACTGLPTSCDLTPEDLIRRKEQKLVDAMVAADIFFNAHFQADRIAVVSSDDDMWPAIKTALQLGSDIIHVHTKQGRSTPTFYAHGITGGYV